VLKQNPNTVKVVFKHYPLPFHKKAVPAAMATIAAQNQGKFWELHDLIFKNQKQLSQEKIEEFASQLGLNMDKFRQDIGSQATRQQLANDIQEAQRIGVRGTPSLYVNGRKVADRSPQGMQKLIDQELARTKK
jgi:protein-disulfide isomerase